ncbi:MAG TPA: fibrobacter succinogenes major paralogous domain-containing protein [Bacteroidales bacterium]|nr:fibrobacter succinogenes major paralogous domain-containing protein [Bacteroidales bacterium]HPS17169.1 fibrobacter succinogenes major paralogous domain-containing protein [Bacteroidales bacterium]
MTKHSLSSIIGMILMLTLSCKKNNNDNDLNNFSSNIAPTVPTLTTTNVSSIKLSTVNVSGKIISDGGAPIITSGICWDINDSPTINDYKTTNGTLSGSFTNLISGLSPNTFYFMRAYATNNIGTGYSNQLFVKTCNDSISDVDGNIYYTIIIGTQEWMIENLKTTKYRNGNSIPLVIDKNDLWDNLTTGAYCNKNNSINDAMIYGKLYNWYAVTDSRCIAPLGWHVPSDAEWNILVEYLGGSNIAGGRLKEASTAHWVFPNTGADNYSGFMGLPSGSRPDGGELSSIGYSTFWWSTSDSCATLAWNRHIDTHNAYIEKCYAYKGKVGFSVRCIKD